MAASNINTKLNHCVDCKYCNKKESKCNYNIYHNNLTFIHIPDIYICSCKQFKKREE